MFNFLMSCDPESWDKNIYEYDLDRYLEDTDLKIREKYKDLNVKTLEDIKQFPTLFTIENEERASRIGYIETIKVRSKRLYIEFKFDPILPPISKGALAQLAKPFDIGRFGMSRTRWSIKDADLFFELIKAGFLQQDQVDVAAFYRKSTSRGVSKQSKIDVLNNDHVFIVHGHDEDAKREAASFVKSVGLKPIILHEQASKGMTIIEKIETYTNVGFAIVLYTPCDLGNARGAINKGLNSRARQNVVLEHGYLMARLGRSRVVALVKENTEIPNDISGIVYIPFDILGEWKKSLKKELSVAGISITE